MKDQNYRVNVRTRIARWTDEGTFVLEARGELFFTLREAADLAAFIQAGVRRHERKKKRAGTA